jgi:hypothetical protein
LKLPTITSVTNATRCGSGTVTLSASVNPGAQANWYSAATGGTAISTGETYTPTVSSSTTYYVTASQGGVSNIAIPGDGDWQHFTTAGAFQTTTITGAYALLTISQPIKLSTFDIYPSSAVGTAYTIEARTVSASGTAAYTYSGVTTVTNSSVPTVAQTVPVDWTLAPGTYYIGFTSNPTCWRSGLATHSYPWVLPGIASLDYYLTPSYQYFFYNLRFGAGCEQPVRTPVTVTTSTPPSITVDATPSTICEGQSTTLSVTSSNSDYSSGWTGGLTGATQTVTPAATTTYTLTAVDSSAGSFAGCGNSSTVTITVNPAPAAVTISDDVTICPGSTTQLTATSSNPDEVASITTTVPQVSTSRFMVTTLPY